MQLFIAFTVTDFLHKGNDKNDRETRASVKAFFRSWITYVKRMSFRYVLAEESTLAAVGKSRICRWRDRNKGLHAKGRLEPLGGDSRGKNCLRTGYFTPVPMAGIW